LEILIIQKVPKQKPRDGFPRYHPSCRENPCHSFCITPKA